MTIRSPNMSVYVKRMTIVVLLFLSVYSIVVSETGGGVFRVWEPGRMRLALVAVLLCGVAAYELRPGKSHPKAESTAAMPIVDKSDSDVPVVDELVAETPAAEVPAAATSDVAVQPAPQPAAREEKAAADVAVAPGNESEHAEALWNEARSMPHGFVPDEVEDSAYLTLVRKAAELGHLSAMVKLGDYAFRRGWIVEAFYWTLLAQLHGAEGLGPALDKIRKTWAMEGNPPEYENVSPSFSEVQGELARTILFIKSGRNVTLAHRRLREFADLGYGEAQLYLSR